MASRGARARALAAILRGERTITAAAQAAITQLLAEAARALAASGYDTSVLDARWPAWRSILSATVEPAVTDVFATAFRSAVRGAIDPDPYATAHLANRANRLVGVADEVFDPIRRELAEGRAAGESIRDLAARVDTLLEDHDRWKGRATTIARTESVSASNYGARRAAQATADLLGVSEGDVVRSWLATGDSRTRESHAAADGQVIVGLTSTYDVGGSQLVQPGADDGPADEVVNCRCTEVFYYPGDPEYADLAAQAGIAVPATPTRDAIAAAADTEEPTVTTTPPETDDPPAEADRAVPTVTADPSVESDADTTLTTEDCPCGDLLVFDTTNGWQRVDGSYSHDDGTTHSEWIMPPTDQQIADDRDPTTEVTAAAGDPAPVVVDADPVEPGIQLLGDVPDLGDQFYGVCTVEDSQTGDGRVFAPGAITWDGVPLPMPAGWQVADAPGHDGSVICGRIDTVTRYGNLIAYTGTWDLDGAGWETRRLVDGRFLTGLSVDTDDFDAQVVDQDGNPVDPMMGMFGEEPDAVLLVTGARIRSWAMCRVPAFVEAFVANGTPPPGWAGERPGAVGAPAAPDTVPVEGDAPVAEPTEEEATVALVAAAGRAANPPATLPASTDFADPGLTGPTAVTVTDDGRVYGHVATWGTCHVGLDGCVTPPTSRAAYAYFMTGQVETDAGWVPVGQITMGTGHAATSLGARPAAAHYDDTGVAIADVFAGEDTHGIWVAGRVRPGTSAAQLATFRASGAISGDWRTLGGNLELVAALAVNVPGFPVPRLSLAASAGEPVALVAAGMLAPPTRTAPAPVTGDRVLSVADVYAAMDRRDRAMAAVARLDTRRAAARRDRAAAAAARITERA